MSKWELQSGTYCLHDFGAAGGSTWASLRDGLAVVNGALGNDLAMTDVWEGFQAVVLIAGRRG